MEPATCNQSRAELEEKVTQLTRENRDLQMKNVDLRMKLDRYEQHTQRLRDMLSRVSASIDILSGQRTAINDILSSSCEVGSSKENRPATPVQSEGRQRALTATVMPMVDGIPIRRIKIPLQRLEATPQRHRIRLGARMSTGGVRWRSQQQRRPRGIDTPARQIVRRTPRANQTPAVNPGRIIRHGNGGGPSQQMLEAVVLLQRLSLTPHQLRRQQSAPLRLSGTLRSPVVMLRDISSSLQNVPQTSQMEEDLQTSEPVQSWTDPPPMFEAVSGPSSSTQSEPHVTYEQSAQSFMLQETVSETEVTYTEASSSTQDAQPNQVVNTTVNTVSTSCELSVVSWGPVVTQADSASGPDLPLETEEEQSQETNREETPVHIEHSSVQEEENSAFEVSTEPGPSSAPSTSSSNKRRKFFLQETPSTSTVSVEQTEVAVQDRDQEAVESARANRVRRRCTVGITYNPPRKRK